MKWVSWLILTFCLEGLPKLHKEVKSNRELWSHESDKTDDGRGPGSGQSVQGMLREGRDCLGKAHQHTSEDPVESVAKHQVSRIRLRGLAAAGGCE